MVLNTHFSFLILLSLSIVVTFAEECPLKDAKSECMNREIVHKKSLLELYIKPDYPPPSIYKKPKLKKWKPIYEKPIVSSPIPPREKKKHAYTVPEHKEPKPIYEKPVYPWPPTYKKPGYFPSPISKMPINPTKPTYKKPLYTIPSYKTPTPIYKRPIYRPHTYDTPTPIHKTPIYHPRTYDTPTPIHKTPISSPPDHTYNIEPSVNSQPVYTHGPNPIYTNPFDKPLPDESPGVNPSTYYTPDTTPPAYESSPVYAPPPPTRRPPAYFPPPLHNSIDYIPRPGSGF